MQSGMTAGINTSINIGYARVSTQDQNSPFNRTPLPKSPVTAFSPTPASGAKTDRTGLAEALRHLRKGDTLVVWKRDRLGRSLKQLIEVALDLQKADRHHDAQRQAGFSRFWGTGRI